MTSPAAASFDEWYEAIAASSRLDPFLQRWLGLSPEVRSSGYLSGHGLTEVLGRLALTPGSALVELGCGRGGYGLAAARATGTHLVGVDFSVVALAAARDQAARLRLDATFVEGDLTASGLPTGGADAVLCVDAFHFAEPPAAAATECRRLLRPGGRLVVTSWEPVTPGDPGLPARLRDADVGRDLAAAGLVDVRTEVRPDWAAVERALWQAALALRPDGDQAIAELVDEAHDFLPLAGLLRRVLLTARAPTSAG